ncbi:type II toxin-antitoxin system VapC family toxin [Aetokthonos hydrillicola Thurmond2011]|uniref:Type II toxin-antitoxin system VapC family toxin n=1 Tax=Aetokthonos hydrillicola Thurmond2011 TaxID=2712845 RepID=A0AAP5I907_9CYAN|nr:type II toxin-antitoxin system VapC family toxin [Aetokthonos hydrillicola]MBO3457811.1 type II toxin-antitoxin system VapC family toxin [Aetokthonos hydrillicola CCALA 1050]MBW4588331.1 type II toxin-antitoxin system VapC family toxin [Aetokthonos hydrillicola CCALA 1050]MDR9897187.1 type II toxin-antitoxin system VapC family toxin [Aetokthonos hydrillicola Thurmond2011]
MDTSPVIYYVEAVPAFAEVVREIFTLIGQGHIVGVVSPVTLAECVTLPMRLRQIEVQQRFMDLLTGTEGILFVNIDAAIGQQAADLRISYGLKLPGALQLATAIAAGCEAFLTNDVALKRVTKLRVLVLGELEV